MDGTTSAPEMQNGISRDIMQFGERETKMRK